MNFLSAKWENLIMANYTVDPAILLPYLPNGVELDSFNGNTYVSLVGFMFLNTKIFKLPIPYLGSFEEINLRFYVKRKVGNEYRRGVVFINETIPFKAVAWVANRLYKEAYISIPTQHQWEIGDTHKKITYQWKVNGQWNLIATNALAQSNPMTAGSEEAYIFEHYYGYTKISEQVSQEYQIHHPQWRTHQVTDFKINCDFEHTYGPHFKSLNGMPPSSVILAEGSPVSVGWKRHSF